MTATTPHDDKELQHSGGDPLPAEAERGHDDGPLDSIGKAIAAPIEGAAEEDEPGSDGRTPPARPG